MFNAEQPVAGYYGNYILKTKLDKKINCAGIGGSLGHPKVYLDMGDLNEIRCPYCSKLFILENS